MDDASHYVFPLFLFPLASRQSTGGFPPALGVQSLVLDICPLSAPRPAARAVADTTN
ncbi:hypothetical protein FRC08_017477 [Ceratobasidium sp. 394]|nr:hypothetical protein FRC08_017477 [Ceratobasidium sp. 394]KAG9100045.1 hypothetical protein FS749_016390 [Ceratobasidium sp. UAMH 11750]